MFFFVFKYKKYKFVNCMNEHNKVNTVYHDVFTEEYDGEV